MLTEGILMFCMNNEKNLGLFQVKSEKFSNI